MTGSIYCADVFCGDCTDEIEKACREDGTVARMIADGADPSDSATYDSHEYPKRCDVECESDSPSHCGSCGVFLENDLTTAGDDYVKETVRDDFASGHDDSIAITIWMPFYDYIDYDVQEDSDG